MSAVFMLEYLVIIVSFLKTYYDDEIRAYDCHAALTSRKHVVPCTSVCTLYLKLKLKLANNSIVSLRLKNVLVISHGQENLFAN